MSNGAMLSAIYYWMFPEQLNGWHVPGHDPAQEFWKMVGFVFFAMVWATVCIWLDVKLEKSVEGR